MKLNQVFAGPKCQLSNVSLPLMQFATARHAEPIDALSHVFHVMWQENIAIDCGYDVRYHKIS